MENKCKRFLSLLLALVMVLGIFPMGHAHVHAAEVEMTPVAPEAGKTYVICFQKTDGTYHAVTSTYAANYVNGDNYVGTLDVNDFTGVYTSDIGWKLIPDGDGYYLNAADDGCAMSLRGDSTYDGFAQSNHPGEVMTLTAVDGGGYTVMNSAGRYLAALSSDGAGTAAVENVTCAGNYTEAVPVYFFEVPIELEVEETYSFTLSGDHSDADALSDDTVRVEASYAAPVVNEFSTNVTKETLEDGEYLLENYRDGKFIGNTLNADNNKLVRTAAVSSDAGAWTIEAFGDGYSMKNPDGKYLSFGYPDCSLVDDPVALTFTWKADWNAWEIMQGSNGLHSYGNEATAAGYPNGGDGASWKLYKRVPVAQATYTKAQDHVTELTDGGKYYLVNRRVNTSLTNIQRTVASSGTNGIGLTSRTLANGINHQNYWVITRVGDRYTVQDCFGSYLTVGVNAAGQGANGQALLKSVESYVDLTYVADGSQGDDYWTISNTVGNATYFMNDYNGGYASYNPGNQPAATGTGNMWYVYPVTETPAVATTTITFTALKPGTTDITIDGITYTVNVNAPEPTVKYAKVLSDDRILDLNDCEYTLGVSDAGYTLSHAGTYNVRLDLNARYHQTTSQECATLTLNWGAYTDQSGRLAIQQGDDRFMWFDYNAATPSWNRYDRLDGNNTGLYLFHENTDGTGNEIPGYTMVTAAPTESGDGYLVAIKNSAGDWYVLNPSATALNGQDNPDHLAKVVELAEGESVHTHTFGEWSVTTEPTCTDTGVKTQACTDTTCGHVHKEIISVDANAHVWGTPEFTWSDTTAIATVTCDNDATHKQTLDGVAVTSSTTTTGNCQTNEVTTYTATVTFDGVEYTDTNEVTGDKNTAVHTGTVAYKDITDETHTKYYPCCGAVVETVDHVWVEGETFDPTFESDGYTEFSCVCTATKKEVVEGTQKVAVARIDDTKYESLNEAIAAAKEGDVVVVLADCALTEAVIIDNTITIMAYEEAVTIDANNVVDAFTVVNGGELTLANVTVESNTALLFANGGIININGATLNCAPVKYVPIYVPAGGTVNVISGTVVSTDNVMEVDGGTANISGGVVKTTAENLSTVYAHNGGTITVTGGEIIGELGANSNGTVNISGGKITGDVGAYGNANATLTITGGDFTDATLFYKAGKVTKADSVELAAPAGYKWDDNGVLVVMTYVAEINGTQYETLQAAFNAAKDRDLIILLADVTLDAYLNVTTEGYVQLDLNEHDITRANGTGIYVNDESTLLHITGTGTVTAAQAVWANAGQVVIWDSAFHGTGDAIYTTGTGKIEIFGGTFSAEESDHTGNTYCVLNQLDADRATSSITVFGGTFVGFNPANNASEGPNTNFVAEGYCAAPDGEGNYTVQAHDYEGIVTDPDCENQGYTTWTCIYCGDSYKDTYVDALGHTEEIIPGKAATCTETGLTEGKKCSVCGEILVAQEEIPMAAHTEEIIPGKAATCTETGLTEGKKCSVCDKVLVAQEVVDALGHDWQIDEKDVCSCTVCSELLTGLDKNTYFRKDGVIFTGIYEDRFYEAGDMIEAYKLVEHEGNIYFVYNGNKIAKGCELYLGEDFVEGIIFSDNRKMQPGYYTFNDDGTMVIPEDVDAVIDGYLYIDGIKQTRYQLVELDGAYYFINDGDKVGMDVTYYLSEKHVAGTGFKPGYYYFGSDGKMVIKNGVEDGYLYVNGAKQEAYQLVNYEGDYYFVSDNHKIAKNIRLYLSDTYVEGTGFKADYYYFDAEGKMVTDGIGADHLYINGMKQPCYMLIEWNDNYYFINDGHKIARSCKLFLSAQFLTGTDYEGEPGWYEFNEAGELIK